MVFTDRHTDRHTDRQTDQWLKIVFLDSGGLETYRNVEIWTLNFWVECNIFLTYGRPTEGRVREVKYLPKQTAR